MDFSGYMKKGTGKYTGDRPVRKCLNCGRELDRDLDYLYLQSFCSEGCKKEYMESGSLG